MSGRHHNCIERSSATALRTATIAGTGVAGLAALFVASPLAHATPAPTSAQEQPAASDASETTTAAASTTAAGRITPDYGTQKYRVGVRVKDGADVPAGTTTAGTTLRIVEKDSSGNVVRDEPCTTVANPTDAADDPADVSQPTFCPGDRGLPDLSRSQQRSLGRLHVNVTTQPGSFFGQYYVAGARNTVTITQTTVNDNLAIDPASATISPCTVAPEQVTSERVAAELELPDQPCLTTVGQTSYPKDTDAIFDDPGLPPVAGDDSAGTKEGEAVTIAVQSNDHPKATLKTVKISSEPGHGTARLVTAEAAAPAPSTSSGSSSASASASASTPEMIIPLRVRQPAGSRELAAVSSYRAIYTPKAGFVGKDTFTYTIATANGTATARVTVAVTGSASEASNSSSDVTTSKGDDGDSSRRKDLADTGAPTEQLLGYAAALLAAGGGAVALGRQRRRGRHAR